MEGTSEYRHMRGGV